MASLTEDPLIKLTAHPEISAITPLALSPFSSQNEPHKAKNATKGMTLFGNSVFCHFDRSLSLRNSIFPHGRHPRVHPENHISLSWLSSYWVYDGSPHLDVLVSCHPSCSMLPHPHSPRTFHPSSFPSISPPLVGDPLRSSSCEIRISSLFS